MKGEEPASFPFEAVRDLLGILRALYAAHQARGAPAMKLSEIRSLAVELRRATSLARKYEPGSLEFRTAHRLAERATLRLSDLIDVTTPLEPTLLAAGERVRNHRTGSGAREAARRARLIRS